MTKSITTPVFVSVMAVITLQWSMTAVADDDTIFATVGDQEITVAEFKNEMAVRGGGLPGQFAAVEQRQFLLDEIIRYRATVAKARAEGYDQDPQVIAIYERAMVARYQKDRLQAPSERPEVTDEEVAAYYAEHRSDYDRPERYRPAIVFFKSNALATEEKQQELLNRVQQALEEAQALDPAINHFGSVARRYSDDRASRYIGGTIGWLVKHPNRQYKWEVPVVEAVFSLTEPGQFAPVVETEKGYYLIRLVDREAAEPRPFDQVKNGIRHQLIRSRGQQLNQAFEADVLAGINVEVNQDIFLGIEAPASAAETVEEQRPPQLPAG